MDKLVKPDVQELCVPFIRGSHKNGGATFKLTNVMHTMSVAVSLTTTNAAAFTVSHPFSIIPPLSSAAYTLRTAASDHPPLRSPLDAVVVKTTMLPTGKASTDVLRRLFAKPGPHVFRDAVIPISMVGPDVVEALILSADRKSLEVAFLFSKAIFWCDKAQLNSLLLCAARCGDGYFVSAVIDGGADVNARDPVTKRSAMALAVDEGATDVVQLLVEAGYKLDTSVDSFLHVAAAAERLDLLQILRLGYPHLNINTTNQSNGQTPLHVAAIHGNVAVIRFLITSGSDPNFLDSKFRAPLHYAAEEGHREAAELLLEHSSLSKYVIDEDGKTPYTVAVEEGHRHLYSVLQLADDLQSAAYRGDVESISACLAGGAEPSCRDQNGWTPLHRAAFKGRFEGVKVLVGGGGRVDAVDDVGYTPFQVAVEAGHMEIAAFLLASGANGNVKGLKSLVLIPPGLLEDGFKKKNKKKKRYSDLVSVDYQGKKIS